MLSLGQSQGVVNVYRLQLPQLVLENWQHWVRLIKVSGGWSLYQWYKAKVVLIPLPCVKKKGRGNLPGIREGYW